jgi:hypothetical protein
LAKSLGVSEANVDGLRKDIKANLEREVKSRLMSRNKQAALQALVDKAELDLPKSSVQSEVDRMVEGARADLKARGIKDADKAPIPDDVFRPQAEKRVRMGLVVADLVRAQKLQATPEKIKAHIEELASSYEKPAEVVRWYYSDMSRLGEVEAMVVENNVTEYIMSHAKVNEKALSFDELINLAVPDLNSFYSAIRSDFVPITSLIPVGSGDSVQCNGVPIDGPSDLVVRFCAEEGAVVYNAGLLNDLHLSIGDNASATLLSLAWAESFRDLVGEAPDVGGDETALMQQTCLTGGWFSTTLSGGTDIQLSSGDLDESILVFASFAAGGGLGRPGILFDTVSSLRQGVVNGPQSCGLSI